jgi:hypothetical protein
LRRPDGSAVFQGQVVEADGLGWFSGIWGSLGRRVGGGQAGEAAVTVLGQQGR